MVLQIRKGTETDIHNISRLQSLTMPEPYETTTWKILFNEKNKEIYIMEDIDKEQNRQTTKIIAYILIADRYEYRGNYWNCHIASLAVDPKYQNKGIGKKMMNFILKTKFSATQFILEVRDHNEKAIRFYKRFGFIISQRIEHFYSNGDNCLIMILNR